MTDSSVNVTVETTGRRDLDNLFSISGILEDHDLSHTPFLAFVVSEDKVVVNVVTSAQRLASDFPPETAVMVQWAGRWRSDFFRMTVADVKDALDRKKVAADRWSKDACSICGKTRDQNGGTGFFAREDQDGFLRVCQECAPEYDAKNPRPVGRRRS